LASAKDLIVKPIGAAEANALVKRVHYSGKVVQNSQLHFGVYIGGRLEGAMQFGPSLDKRKLLPIVEGAQWNGFIELNRMAFSDALPRNSESRALGVALRMLRKHAPHLEWVVSFADATQCGDGTIYRAAGFVLTSIKTNNQIWEAKGGERFSRTSLTDGRSKQQQQQAVRLCRVSATKGSNILATGGASMSSFKAAGFTPIPGYQLRYLYFLNPAARQRLTVPILPFAEIDRRGAGMYRGKPRAGSAVGGTSANHAGGGGSTPTPALSISGASTDQITEG
jgi:hypothetical protein